MIPKAHAADSSAAFGTAIGPVVTYILNPIIGMLFTFGLFVFVYGVIEMIIKGESAEARSTGQKHMLAGAIGMFIMVSAWGFIHLISSTIAGL